MFSDPVLFVLRLAATAPRYRPPSRYAWAEICHTASCLPSAPPARLLNLHQQVMLDSCDKIP